MKKMVQYVALLGAVAVSLAFAVNRVASETVQPTSHVMGDSDAVANTLVYRNSSAEMGAIRVTSSATAGYSAGFLGVWEGVPPTAHHEGDFGYDLTYHALAISTKTFAASGDAWMWHRITDQTSVWTEY